MKAKITQRSVEAAKPAAKPWEIRDTGLTGFALRIQPSGRKTYAVNYGRNRRYTIGNAAVLTPTQARERAKQILGQVAEGLDPMADKRRPETATLRDFIEGDYRPWAQAHRKHGDAWCDQILRVFASLADDSLIRTTAHRVEAIRTERLNQGIKPSTVNRNMTCLRGALSYAIRAGYLAEHPLIGVKDSDTDDRGIVRYLSSGEAQALCEALRARDDEQRKARERANAWRSARNRRTLPPVPNDGYGDYLTPLVIVSLKTGARRGEMFNLQRADVDFDLSQITIRGATSKKNRKRHIPLNETALGTLRIWKLQTSGDGLVFSGRKGERLENVRKSWAGVLRDAKVSNFRWHDLRHTFASWLVMRGVDLNTVRELLGHGDLKMTLRYAHLAPEHKAEAVSRLL